MKNFLVGIAALAVSSGVMAQEGYTVEGVAKVRENETARFYPDSVLHFLSLGSQHASCFGTENHAVLG